ncbi:MAG: hypothetical protein BWK80_03550 [Desulfobacteraceae bacterium IS3]|nr:MAG: hypothetical protein BWK80_03550 [Desulfobacteraceae bacterium IS3]
MKRNLNYLIILLVFTAVFGVAYTSGAELLQVQIRNLDRAALVSLFQMDIDIDSVHGSTARAYIFSDRLDDLRKLGYDITVIPNRIKRDSRLLTGYPNLSELASELREIEAAYPNLCRLYNIGASTRGHELWFMKISDNVDAEEDEPEFHYISSMHGDEPVGMELCLNLIHLLTDDYSTDERITDLVNETEIWIMPLMNPDGYASQERYNAQNKDLNRSFPDQYHDPVNTVSGRPTETQHVMNWAFAHSPALSANLHGGDLVVNYPYDSNPEFDSVYSACPDDGLFIQMALSYTSQNLPMKNGGDFDQGITNGAAWYHVKGGMQDWKYVWIGCNEVTIELGYDKLPPFSEIENLWNDNREAMLTYMEWSLKGVRGIVTDSVTGKPLDATVSVSGIDHDVYTDSDVGDYHRMLLSGTYQLSFSAAGYRSQTVLDVIVGEGNATRLDVSLRPEILPGDVNDDGKIDLADFILAIRAVIENALDLYKKADVSGDARIGLEEAVYLLRELAASEP